jgi:hypothetical protein
VRASFSGGPGPARASRFSRASRGPAGDALAERFATGRLNRQEELPLLEILAITQATGGQSYRAGIPRGLQRAMLPAAAALARLRD